MGGWGWFFSFFFFFGVGCFERLYFFSKFFTQGWSKTLIKGIRSEVSYTRILLTRSLYSLERPGLNLIWPLMILSLISLGWTPVKGALPWTNSYSKIPRDQRSNVWLWFLFCIISGAMYSRVPQKVFLCCMWSDWTHHPKSQILMIFPSLINMFSGFISLWISPCLCK